MDHVIWLLSWSMHYFTYDKDINTISKSTHFFPRIRETQVVSKSLDAYLFWEKYISHFDVPIFLICMSLFCVGGFGWAVVIIITANVIMVISIMACFIVIAFRDSFLMPLKRQWKDQRKHARHDIQEARWILFSSVCLTWVQ